MNRSPQPEATRPEIVPVDPARHALQARIERSKSSLFEDLDHLSQALRQTASSTAKRVVLVVVAAGVLAVALVAAALVRPKKQLRFRWR